jgi:hypothetical protein
MKKLFAFAFALTLIFSIRAFAQSTGNIPGYEENFNDVCGPVYGGPNEDECTAEFELYVYYPLYVDCVCEGIICLGWFTPDQTYDITTAPIEERSCEFVAYGEDDLWVAFHGSWVYVDGDVTLADIQWEETATGPWSLIASNNPATGEFFQDFALTGTGTNGPGWGYRYFRTGPETVIVGPSAHGDYFFSATLEGHYNF